MSKDNSSKRYKKREGCVSMEISKISFGASAVRAGRKVARKATGVINNDVLGSMRGKQKLATAPNSQNTRRISTWDARYRQC